MNDTDKLDEILREYGYRLTPTGRKLAEELTPPDPAWPTYDRETRKWTPPQRENDTLEWQSFTPRPGKPFDYGRAEREIVKLLDPPKPPPSRLSYLIAALIGSFLGQLLWLLGVWSF